MRLKFFIYCIGSLAMLTLALSLITCNTGCTQSQVAQVETGLNQINDAVVSPLADQQGASGLSPYIRWLFSNVRTFGYAAIDFVRVASPNAGESAPPLITPPATQPAASLDPLPARSIAPYRPAERARLDLAMSR